MTDHELLEAAAKAAGYEYGEDGVWVDAANGIGGNWEFWNPLTDDGDALRLAVKLNLQIAPDPANSMTGAWLAREDDAEPIEDSIVMEFWKESDHCAATRRAIVRAAAAIAKSNDMSES